ncbi:polysaccharide deacetylase family protein [Salinigranum halophilum]|jgi:peptidoglycan/xylan/chitin deacetylase (PgdA/CDA1 family)|uniref:polysaccharide deacetylase family protein n=1 Tax=Salinigranum halophilum TaxID=2565931 RepID=UPI00115ED3EF|nr:polysaccharide deacetylase [Salinigranum halophilum]
MAQATVCLSYDFDAVSTWLWSYDSWDEPTRHSRGVFGAEVGAPRLLDLHDKYDVPATWFVPGHTIESFPEICGEVWDRGGDIQHHGWSHTGPATFESEEDERADVERAVDNIVDLTGRKPTGYRSPAWDFSSHTLDILADIGIRWESSKMASDFTPHYVYGGWEAPPDGPYVRGEPTDIVELPVSWQRDDWPPFTFTWARPHRMGYVSEDSIFRRWYDQFDWMYENVDDGVFILTMHPQVIGQAHRIMRLEALIQHMSTKPGVEFKLMDTVAEEWREANPPA